MDIINDIETNYLDKLNTLSILAGINQRIHKIEIGVYNNKIQNLSLLIAIITIFNYIFSCITMAFSDCALITMISSGILVILIASLNTISWSDRIINNSNAYYQWTNLRIDIDSEIVKFKDNKSHYDDYYANLIMNFNMRVLDISRFNLTVDYDTFEECRTEEYKSRGIDLN